MGKTSLLELNGMNMSHSSTKETIINELEECFFFFAQRPVVTQQVNFPRKITFDMLYTNEFVIRVRSRALSIPSECTTI